LPLKNGDFVLIDYTARIKETGEVFDTTIEEEAKKAGLSKQGALYAPSLAVVGEGWVLKGLDEKLVGLEAEKPAEVEVPPEKGFGPRDSSKIRLVPLRRFRAQKITPFPGLRVDVDGKPAVIRAVGAGRVQVDFNPPLAGKTLVYSVSVRKLLESEEDKIRALLRRRFLTDEAKFGLKLEEKAVVVEVPEEVIYQDGLQFAKRGLANDIHHFFDRFDTVSFVEVFKRRQESPAEEKKEQDTAQQGS